MDNLKGMLIILVVVGHMLELVMDKGISKYLYEWIYTFHMPLFVFISGYFYHFNFKKLFCNLIYPYVIFQFLFCLFSRLILGSSQAVNFTKPYWVMWYLMAMIIWSLAAILFTKTGTIGKIIWIVLSSGAALAIGWLDIIGREYALSRTIVFFPFFLWGNLYAGKEEKIIQTGFLRYVLFILAAAYSIILGFHYKDFLNKWFYETESYKAAGMTAGFRAGHLLLAVIFIVFFLVCMTDRQLPFLSKAGRNTMQIFLLHGFIVKLLGKYHIMKLIPYPKAAAFLIAVCLVWLLSADWLGRILGPLMKGNFYEKKKSISDCIG